MARNVGTQQNGDSIWAQNSKDVNSQKGDESIKIFDQMTQSGIISTETGKKNGGNGRSKGTGQRM